MDFSTAIDKMNFSKVTKNVDEFGLTIDNFNWSWYILISISSDLLIVYRSLDVYNVHLKMHVSIETFSEVDSVEKLKPGFRRAAAGQV
jgi:hypothetical protein